MSRRYRLVGISVVALGLVAAQCNPPDAGDDIVIRRGGELVWTRSAPANAAWDTVDMTPLPGLGFDYFDRSRPKVFTAEFRPFTATETAFSVGLVTRTPLVVKSTPELHLFARDPQEVYDTLLSLPVDQWRREITTPKVGLDSTGLPPYYLPADVVLPYNLRFPQTRIVNPLPPEAFWRHQAGFFTSPSLWYGIATGPGDYGSIKAARTIQLPECSTSVPVQPLLDTFGGRVSGLVTSQACFRGDPVDVSADLQDLTAVQYLVHDSDPAGGPRLPTQGLRGGLLVSGKVHAQVTSNLINSFCNLQFIYDYGYVLNDGFVSLSPKRLSFLVDDHDKLACSGINLPLFSFHGAIDILQRALEKDVPAQVLQQSRDLQQFPPAGAADTPPFTGEGWQCTYAALPDSNFGNQCERAQGDLLVAARTGAFNLGLSLSSAENDQIQATVSDPRNWRCRPPTSDELSASCAAAKPVRGRCQFQLRMASTIVEPDELRLVPFDRFDDYSRPGAVLFLASFVTQLDPNTGSYIDTELYKSLCTPARDPATEPGNIRYYNRYFAGTSVPPVTCVLPPPKFIPPPDRTLVCPCGSNSDCAQGDRCSLDAPSKKRICEAACNSSADCEFGTCYTDIHLCGGSPCDGMQLACKLWEYCDGVGAGVGGYGTCKRRP